MQWWYQKQYLKAALFCAIVGGIVYYSVGLKMKVFKIPDPTLKMKHSGELTEYNIDSGY